MNASFVLHQNLCIVDSTRERQVFFSIVYHQLFASEYVLRAENECQLKEKKTVPDEIKARKKWKNDEKEQ